MCQALFFNKVAGLNTFSYRAHPVAAFVYFQKVFFSTFTIDQMESLIFWITFST